MSLVAQDSISIDKFRRLITIGGASCTLFWLVVAEVATRL